MRQLPIIRTIILSALFFTIASEVSLAQTAKLNLYGAYVFRDKFPYSTYYSSEASIDDGAMYGAGLEIGLRPHSGVEILYLNMPTTGTVHGYNGFKNISEDLKVEYIMIGGMGYKPLGSGKASGFGGLLLGAGMFNSDGVHATKFALGGRLGLLIDANDKIGIRLGAQLLSPIQGAGGGLYFGTGGGGVGVSTYSQIFQFGFFGGLSFSFGGNGGGAKPQKSTSSTPPMAPATPGVPPPPPPPTTPH